MKDKTKALGKKGSKGVFVNINFEDKDFRTVFSYCFRGRKLKKSIVERIKKIYSLIITFSY